MFPFRSSYQAQPTPGLRLPKTIHIPSAIRGKNGDAAILVFSHPQLLSGMIKLLTAKDLEKLVIKYF
jgi:hypothetical protein